MAFEKQFLIADHDAVVPEHWVRHRYGPWVLHVAPDLPVTPLQEGEVRLGWAVEHLGRQALLRFSGDAFEFQLDDCGFLAAVFSPAQRTLCSTTGLLQAKDGFRYDIPQEDHWYPFGLTGKQGIHRLLPNHVLDSTSFTARRVQNPTLQPTGDDAELAQQIADRLRTNVELICRHAKAEINLTAGRDSRMILAAARAVAPDVSFVTTRLPTFGAKIDCELAGRIAGRFGLRHTIRPFLNPRPDDLAAWQRDTGACVAGQTWKAVTTSRHAPPDVVRVSGLCGEIARGFYWEPGDREVPAVPELLRRMHLPVAGPVVAAGEAWLQTTEGTVEQVLDLAYIEQRLGCWAGPAFYGHHHHLCTFSPFNDTVLIRWMQQLSPAYRQAERLAEDVIRRLWPELLEFPFNPVPPAGPLRRCYRRARTALRAALKPFAPRA